MKTTTTSARTVDVPTPVPGDVFRISGVYYLFQGFITERSLYGYLRFDKMNNPRSKYYGVRYGESWEVAPEYWKSLFRLKDYIKYITSLPDYVTRKAGT